MSINRCFFVVSKFMLYADDVVRFAVLDRLMRFSGPSSSKCMKGALFSDLLYHSV